MNIFIAAAIPLKTAQELFDTLTPIIRDYPDLSWLSPSQYHLTLYYIGDVDRTHYPLLEKEFTETLFDVDAATISTRSTDLFIYSDLTLYFSMKKNPVFDRIHDHIAARFEDKSRKEKVYIPHITFAKSRIPSKQQYLLLRKKLQHMEVVVPFDLREVVLFEREQNNVFSLNHPVFSIPLNTLK